MTRVAVLAAALAAALPALAQQAATEAAHAAAASVVRITASVEAIDAANRTMTLRGPRGRVVTLPVAADVHNFDQIKAGDIVVVRYVEALALELKKSGPGMRERAETEAATVAKPGERPAAAEARQTTIVADVIGVDPRRQIVTLRGGRRTIDVKVRDPNQLKLLKAGDQVEATFAEAAVVAVEPAPRAARAIQLGS